MHVFTCILPVYALKYMSSDMYAPFHAIFMRTHAQSLCVSKLSFQILATPLHVYLMTAYATSRVLRTVHVLYSYFADVPEYCCAHYGEGVGPIHIINLMCHGSEYRINSCSYDNSTQGRSHYYDWSVDCYRG